MAFYAVKTGRQPGVYNSWGECFEQVNGFSGAVYKKFNNVADAEAFVSGIAGDPDEFLTATDEQSNVSGVSTGQVVVLYTDGACSGNPGPGGFGYAVVINGGLTLKGSGGRVSTTNNQMEISAVIEGLKAISNVQSVVVYSDSSYVVDTFQKHWIDVWQRRNWVKSDGSPVLNSDLWRQLLAEVARFKDVRFVWVKGHAGNKYNELCDKLAVNAIKHLKQ